MEKNGSRTSLASQRIARICKNLQKNALTNVNMQKTGKSFLQFFAFSFFCRQPYLQIFAYFTSPHRPSAYYLTVIIGAIRIDYQLLIFADFTFCIGK